MSETIDFSRHDEPLAALMGALTSGDLRDKELALLRAQFDERRSRLIQATAYLNGFCDALAQGNKRASFVAMVEFLGVNGHDLAVEDTLPWAERIIDLVERRLTEEDLVGALRRFVVRG